jgi:hypothetical protein
MENVIGQFAEAFRKNFVADHPGLEISMRHALAVGVTEPATTESALYRRHKR